VELKIEESHRGNKKLSDMKTLVGGMIKLSTHVEQNHQDRKLRDKMSQIKRDRRKSSFVNPAKI
jgi:hypothetical protein